MSLAVDSNVSFELLLGMHLPARDRIPGAEVFSPDSPDATRSSVFKGRNCDPFGESSRQRRRNDITAEVGEYPFRVSTTYTITRNFAIVGDTVAVIQARVGNMPSESRTALLSEIDEKQALWIKCYP